jgi:hypothetical protein
MEWCGVVFYHDERELSLVVHGDDFTFCGEAEDLKWIEGLMRMWFEIKVRAILGKNPGDDKEVVILNRTVRWTQEGIEYQADPKHRRKLLEYFGMDESSNVLKHNGIEDRREEEWDEEELGKGEAKEFRGLAARVNCLSLDCPDLPYPYTLVSTETANLGNLNSDN